MSLVFHNIVGLNHFRVGIPQVLKMCYSSATLEIMVSIYCNSGELEKPQNYDTHGT